MFDPELAETARRIEALLFAASGPLSEAELARRLPEGAEVAAAVETLRERYEGRGVELACIAGRWRFQTAEDLAWLMTEEREEQRHYRPALPTAYPLDDARERLRFMLPELAAWTPLGGVAPMPHGEAGPSRASYLASTLSAGLELVKEGLLEARQLEDFADLFLRRRKEAA